jgi:hypothetical protein
MSAGAAAADHLDPACDSSQVIGDATRKPLHRRCDRVETVHARAALARALASEVTRDARHLSDRAGVVGQSYDRACAERRSRLREVGVEQPESLDRTRVKPGAEVAAHEQP